MHDDKVSVYSAGENSGCSFSVEIAMRSKLHCEDPASIEIVRTIQAFQAVQALQCDSKEMKTMELVVELGLGGMNHLTRLISVASTYKSNSFSIKSLSEIGRGSLPLENRPSLQKFLSGKVFLYLQRLSITY
jgi:hypothetical protein